MNEVYNFDIFFENQRVFFNNIIIVNTMRKTIKRVFSVVLAATVAVSGVAYTGTKASAASSYKAVMGYADKNWNWAGGNDSSKDTNKTAVTVKNKKGTDTYTVTLKNKKSKNADAQVFYVDIKDILKDHKVNKLKVSGVSVKCDGKTVSGMKAVATGALEKNDKKERNKFRISIYNRVGNKANGDKTASYPSSYGKKFKFKKSISVTFKLTIK